MSATPHPPRSHPGTPRIPNPSATIAYAADTLKHLNAQLDDSRRRCQDFQERRALELHEKDQKRNALLAAQHSARRKNLKDRVLELEEKERIEYEVVHSQREQQRNQILGMKLEEIDRRHQFSNRRQRVLESREQALTELQVQIFHTPSPSRSPRSVSPLKMSKEVIERLLPSPRGPNEPPHSKEAIQEIQRKREEQVEQQRIVQQQQMNDKKKRREEHLEILRGRLDEIVRKARQESAARMSKKKEEEDRIRQWKWKKRNKLRAEAIERLEREEANGGTSEAVDSGADSPPKQISNVPKRPQNAKPANQSAARTSQSAQPAADKESVKPADNKEEEQPISLGDMTGA